MTNFYPGRWLFILEGCVTIAVALIAALVLPNYPKSMFSTSFVLILQFKGKLLTNV